MSKDKRLQIRLSEEDYNKLESYASQKDISMAQVLREYIKRLPHPKALLAIFAFATIAALSFPTPLRARVGTAAMTFNTVSRGSLLFC